MTVILWIMYCNKSPSCNGSPNWLNGDLYKNGCGVLKLVKYSISTYFSINLHRHIDQHKHNMRGILYMSFLSSCDGSFFSQGVFHDLVGVIFWKMFVRVPSRRGAFSKFFPIITATTKRKHVCLKVTLYCEYNLHNIVLWPPACMADEGLSDDVRVTIRIEPFNLEGILKRTRLWFPRFP